MVLDFLLTLFLEVFGFFFAIFLVILTYYKWRFQYWKKKNVPYLEPTIPFGNSENLFVTKKSIGIQMKGFYDQIRKKGWKQAGVYIMASPVLVITDLDLLRNILLKDFENFTDRGIYFNDNDVISAHLFNLGGARWRKLRSKLTPTFTSGKMKMMFNILLDCEKHLQGTMQTTANPVDIKEVLARFTTDVIGSCAFGLDFGSIKNEDSPFRVVGRRVFTLKKSLILKKLFGDNFPSLAKRLDVRTTPKDIVEFYRKVVDDTVEYREKNKISRNDFMQLMIDLKAEDIVSLEEIEAQSFVFFAAGFETSSTAMTFALYELSRNPKIQDKVRTEIDEVLSKYDGKITYDGIQEMRYLQKIIDETLRMYPPLPLITRRCVKDYKLPEENVVIEKGTLVFVPILGIQRDRKYYPDPDQFNPERFTPENKKSRHQFAYLPFGEGPRLCIGMRFGLMQSKIGLISLLTKYRFKVNRKTKEPLTFQNSNTLTLSALGEIWLDAARI